VRLERLRRFRQFAHTQHCAAFGGCTQCLDSDRMWLSLHFRPTVPTVEVSLSISVASGLGRYWWED